MLPIVSGLDAMERPEVFRCPIANSGRIYGYANVLLFANDKDLFAVTDSWHNLDTVA